MRKNHRSTALLVILLVVGLIIGGLIGELLGTYVPAVNISKDVGFSATNINIGVMTLVLGLNINLNLGSVLGIIFALLLYREM